MSLHPDLLQAPAQESSSFRAIGSPPHYQPQLGLGMTGPGSDTACGSAHINLALVTHPSCHCVPPTCLAHVRHDWLDHVLGTGIVSRKTPGTTAEQALHALTPVPHAIVAAARSTCANVAPVASMAAVSTATLVIASSMIRAWSIRRAHEDRAWGRGLRAASLD